MLASIKRFSSRNTILKNFSVLTLSSALSQFLFIFTSIKIARTLSPELFGTYNLLQLHVSIFTVIASFGIRQIIIRSIARDKTSIKKVFSIALIIRSLGLFFSITLFVAYYFITGKYDVIFFVLSLFCILSSSLFDLFESVAFGLEKMEFSGIINFFNSLCWLTTILIIPNSKLSLHVIFGLFVFFSSLKTIIYFFSIHKTEYIKGFTLNSTPKNEINIFSKECFPYYYLALFTLLSNQIPLLFLEYRSGVAQVGFFNIASKVLMPINLILTTTLAAIFPNLSRLFVTDYKQFIRNVKLIFTLISIFGIAGAFGVTLFRQEVIQLLYGEKYKTTSLVLGFQIWYVAIYSGVCLIGTILGAINKQKQLSYLSILCTLIQVPILWYGAKYGAQYLSAAFLVATAINFVIHIFVIHSYLKSSIQLSFYFKIMSFYVIGYLVSLLTPVGLGFPYKVVIFLLIALLGAFFIFNKYKTEIRTLFNRKKSQ